MPKIKDIFTKDVISYYKHNKDEITLEVLDELRKYDNTGKQIALDILETFKNEEGYYIDAFDNPISYNGIITLKRSSTKMKLSRVHEEEIEKCMLDVKYFMMNYCKLVTKSGTNFPELRPYQDEYLDYMVNDEAVVSLQSRQSGKSVIAGVYLLWLALFKEDILIGIAANKNASAKEILDKIKKIYLNLPMWLVPGLVSFNKTFIEMENGVKILTDSTNGDSFRGYTVNCLYLDEVAWVKPTQWEEFADAVFPAQGALSWKKTIMTSTMKGLNHWYQLVQKAKTTDEFTFHEAKWVDVPRYDKHGDLLTPEAFREMTINKHGILYWNQNYLNEAIGSSHTLLSADTLKLISAKEPQELWDNKLKVYHKPEKGHQYIMSVDPSVGEAGDYIGVQVIDITNSSFIQAASAKLQIDYLLMPEYINEWCEKFNMPLLIVENNTGSGQSIADIMWREFEYENMYFDMKADANTNNITKLRKKYPGFRTTTRTRKQILDNMKMFIENGKLEVNDYDTIREFFTFVLISNKYQADEGLHDDMVMSLAVAFAPFCNIRNFEDMNKVTSSLMTTTNENFVDNMVIGSFDDGIKENEVFSDNNIKEYLTYEDYLMDVEGFV